MRQLFLPLIFLIILLSGPRRFLEAQEIEITGGINNFAFDPAETGQIQQFEGFPCIIGDIFLSNNINNILGYKFNITRDPVIRNYLNGNMTVNTENVNLEFGAFFGIDDTFKKPDFGIAGSIELIFPGIIFLSVNGSTSVDIVNQFLGNNNRETVQARFGFWLPNLLPVLSAEIKTYTREEENSLIIRDESIRLMFSADIFAKNMPLIIRIDAGYDTFTRSYESENFNNVEFKNVFAGLEIKWQIIRQLRLIAGFEMPVYIIEPSVNPPNIINLFKAYGGLALTFF